MNNTEPQHTENTLNSVADKLAPISEVEAEKNRQLLDEAYQALKIPGKFGYVLCLHILSQWDSSINLSPEEQTETPNKPLTPHTEISTPPSREMDAPQIKLSNRKQGSNGQEKNPKKPGTTEKRTPLRITRHMKHFNFSAHWSHLWYRLSLLANWFSLSNKKQDDYKQDHKIEVLHASWQFCRAEAPLKEDNKASPEYSQDNDAEKTNTTEAYKEELNSNSDKNHSTKSNDEYPMNPANIVRPELAKPIEAGLMALRFKYGMGTKETTLIPTESFSPLKKASEESTGSLNDDLDLNQGKTEANEDKTTITKLSESQKSKLKWQVYYATSAIKQHRKNSRDFTHWFFVIIAALYALACGTTIAGALLIIVGSGGLSIPLVIVAGLTTWWVNWQNGKFRIPAIMEELFFMPRPKGEKSWLIGRLFPGTVFYIDETTNTIKKFDTFRAGVVQFGIVCSLGVGIAIGAITYIYTMELAGLAGIASTSFFPPLLIIVLITVILAEIGLQLKSFIDIVRRDLLKERKEQFDKMVGSEGTLTKCVAYGIGFITLAICTAALLLLAFSGRKAMNTTMTQLFPKAVDSTIFIVSIVITALHFIGTLPFNIDMTITAVNAGAAAMTSKPSDTKNSDTNQVSRWHKIKNRLSTIIPKYALVFFIGFLFAFALAALVLTGGGGHFVGIALGMIFLKSAGVGLGGGVVGVLAHKHQINLREDPETNPPFFAALGNGILNGFMALSEGVLGIVTNAVMSIVASFAGHDLPKSKFLRAQEKERDEKIIKVIQPKNLLGHNQFGTKKLSRPSSRLNCNNNEQASSDTDLHPEVPVSDIRTV